MADKEFKYEVDKDFNYTIDERGNSFIALRKIRWGDNDNYKLDIRKYISTEKGEQMMKGFSFITDDGPNELSRVLLDTGYGKPDEIAQVIVDNRKDIFNEISKRVNGEFTITEDNESDEELFDARRLFDE